jgi:hypothetical protein
MVLVGNDSDGSGNNQSNSIFNGFATNMAFIGNDSDNSGNNSGAFNFVLVGNNTDNAGNNTGIINVAIFPNPGGGNCDGPACFNFFGTQFFGGS